MTTETETPRQLAEREAESTKGALNDWSQSAAQLRVRAAALAGELETVRAQLHSARLAAVAGNVTDEQVATLAERERSVEAGLAETNQRITAVEGQIQAASAAAAAAQSVLSRIVAQDERERIAGLAEAADRKIEAAYDALTEALNDRYQYEGTVHLNWGSIHINQPRHPYSLVG